LVEIERIFVQLAIVGDEALSLRQGTPPSLRPATTKSNMFQMMLPQTKERVLIAAQSCWRLVQSLKSQSENA